MDDVDKIKSKLDIVELIGERLQLKKAGRNFKANCPFHNEKTPSFVISPERQIWHCFGCNKGGDIFSFITEYENISFAEALRELAGRAGVKLTSPIFRSEKEKKEQIIYSLNHLASQFYNYLLLSHPSGKSALEYLTKKRKLTIPLIKTFMLGYAPPRSALSNYLIKKKKYDPRDLVTAGLAFSRGAETLDFFRNRIIFPIIDHRGNVVAFSGRLLEPVHAPQAQRARSTYDLSGPKYINTRETPVYIKGDTVFGLNLARDAIKSEGKVIIVEGEFDVITAHKEGILNIVAVKGTALTDAQIKLLKRFAPKFAFCFDTDPAGTEAQRRSIQMIEQEGITATVIIQPQGKDPDELLNENPVTFKKALRDDVSVYDFIIDSAMSQFDKTTAEGKKSILSKTLSYLAAIENEVIKEHYLKKLAEELGTSHDSILKEVEKQTRPEKKPEASAKSQLPHEEMLEIYLLSLIFQSKNPKKAELLVRGVLQGLSLATLSLQKVLNYLEKFEQKETSFSPREFAAFLPPELHVPFDTAYLAPIPEFIDEEHFERELSKTAKQVRVAGAKKMLKSLSEQIKNAEKGSEGGETTKLHEEFNKYTKLLSLN